MPATLKATAIDHVNLTVKNLAESVSFFEQLFGFEVIKDQPDQASQIIGNDSIKLCLYEDPNLDIGAGINHYGFHVENFDAVVEACRTLGVSMPYGTVDWGPSRSVYITDPSGYEIELSEVPGGGL
ncbi:MAG: VOC family protein [Candidatus Marinimicrobia bacterium]|nr:VOC family protein [Candidatus Neomarinimicrobiota bacterium]